MSNPRFFGTAKMGNDQRSVMILMPFIQPSQHARVDEIDFDNSLVVDLDILNNDVGEQLSKMANNYNAGEFKTLMEYFEGKSLRNSDRVIAWLHNNKQIHKIPSSDIIMQGANYSVKEVNQIIKKEMLDKQPARDVDDARRDKAQEYYNELKESKEVNDYPSFDNPSESSDYVPPEVPSHVQQESELKAPTLTVDDVKTIHNRLINEYNNTQDKLSSAVYVVNQLKGTLSDDMVQSVASELKTQTGNKEVKDYLMEALATHYDHVDVDYIKKNLDNAEKRKSKETKE